MASGAPAAPPIFLANGFAGADAFPAGVLAESAAEVLRTRGDVALQYGPVQGLAEVRELVAAWLREDGLPDTQADDVFIVPGGKQALSLVARALATTGCVLTSTPTYMTGLHLFRANGLRTAGIPTDDDGLRPDVLERRLASWPDESPPALLYTMSDFHNPTGSVMSAARRAGLVDVAQRHGVSILEDNPYRWLRMEGTPEPPLASFGDTPPVVAVGSFSKILAPGLRLAWMTVPDALREHVLAFGLELAASPFAQLLVHRYFTTVPLQEHLAHTTALYCSKRNVALDALEQYMPDGVSWSRPHGGYYLWLSVPGVQAAALAPHALDAGVAVYAGEAFYPDDAKPDGTRIRLNYAHETPDRIADGIRILAAVVRRLRADRKAQVYA